MKVPSEYLDKLLKPDALKDKDARHELGVHLDALVGDGGDLAIKVNDILAARSWRTFTPGLYQGAAVACTVTFARYRMDGKTMLVEAQVAATAAGTAGNTIAMTGLPFAPRYHDAPKGFIELKDASAGVWYSGGARTQAGFGSGKYVWGIVSASNNAIGINPAITLAAGDILSISIMTEAAP